MERSFGGEEVIMFDGFGKASACDETVLHAPQLRYALPLVEGFSVEQRCGCCRDGRAEGGEGKCGEREAGEK